LSSLVQYQFGKTLLEKIALISNPVPSFCNSGGLVSRHNWAVPTFLGPRSF
jgi:hypothetical protein